VIKECSYYSVEKYMKVGKESRIKRSQSVEGRLHQFLRVENNAPLCNSKRSNQNASILENDRGGK